MLQLKQIVMVVALLLCGANTVKASDLDSLLVEEYRAGRNHITRIIEAECLTDSLQGHSFYAYSIGEAWFIVVDKQDALVMYYPKKECDSIAWSSFSKETDELATPFELKNMDLEGDKRTYSKEYTPFYTYFVLFDSSLDICFEWSSSTTTAHHDAVVNSALTRCVLFLYEKTDFFSNDGMC